MVGNRSSNGIEAWAVIENRGNKLALFSREVPVFWLRKIAQARADQYNNGEDHVHVEKVTIHQHRKARMKKTRDAPLPPPLPAETVAELRKQSKALRGTR